MKIRRAIMEIEERRGSTLLVFAASHLDLELLPSLYDLLSGIGRSERLDILFYCRGGYVTAARRIALLLDRFTDRLAFIVPDRCESSGTITVLAGREIVAGDASVFSPVDPNLETQGPSSDGAPSAISAEDIRLFGRMASAWFGLDEAEAGPRALALLSETIFPTTLTSFYRSTLEAKAICEELLSLHMPAEAGEAKSRIVDQLLFGHHSHAFALGPDDLVRIGLPVGRDAAVEACAWEIAAALRASVGGGARPSEEDQWLDALLATRAGGLGRRRSPGGLAPSWQAIEIE